MFSELFGDIHITVKFIGNFIGMLITGFLGFTFHNYFYGVARINEKDKIMVGFMSIIWPIALPVLLSFIILIIFWKVGKEISFIIGQFIFKLFFNKENPIKSKFCR